ncbi:MAG: diguanylate cyclase [Lachnospiraceae bacterium]|nr:diguanylate cyclase [Lachnospiraceae bacterium]
MNRLIQKLRLLIVKDVSDEKETKDLAVLLRVLSLVYIAYYIFAAIFLALLFHYTHAFIALICAGLLSGCFISTYDNQTRLALRLFNVVTIASASYFTLATGWSMNFQWNILISILVLFYSLEIKMSQKLRYMKLLFTLIVALAVFTHMAPPYRQGSELFSFFFQTIHAFFYGGMLCTLAYCYCTKFNLAEDKLRQSNKKLIEMASLDALTQLPNRRSMTEHLNVLVYENDRTGKPFCIAIGDVDFFKRVNDTYGHDTGDYVLTTLAQMFQNIVKGRGKVARWGGEEFLFCFEGMNVQQARAALEVLRLQIEKYNFQFKDQNLKLTMTFGLEEYSQIIGIEAAISKADGKLYEGKSNGRNQVVY